MKKRLLFIIVLALVIVSASIYFIYQNLVDQSNDPFVAIPADAALIFKLHDPANEITKMREDSFFHTLLSYEIPSRLNDQLLFLDTLLKEDEGQFQFSDPVYAALMKVKADDYGIIYIIATGKKGKKSYDLLESNFGRRPVKRTFQGAEIHEYEIPAMDATFALSYHEGLVLCSFEPFLLETSISQLGHKNSLANDPALKEVRALGGKNEDPGLYINFKALPEFLSIYLNDHFSKQAGYFGQFTEWVSLSYKLASNMLVFNGYAAHGEKSDHFLTQLSESDASMTIASVLPYNTALYYGMNASSLNDKSGLDEKEQKIYEDHFMNWTGNEVGLAIVEPFSPNYENESFVIVHAPDTTLANAQLKELVRLKSGELEITPTEYKGYRIYRIPDFSSLEKMAGLSSNIIRDPFYTIADDYLIFGNSIANIKVLLERVSGQQTLSKDMDYIRFREQMTDHPAFNLYINTGRILQLLKHVASSRFKAYLEQHFNAFKQLNPIGIQLNHYKENDFLVNAMIQSSEGFQQKTNLLWKAELDTLAAMKPVITINHYTGEKEILIQDANDALYLISNSGEILWKRTLDSRITGPVQMVDFYSNDKIQYFFTTRQKIYLMDRNGNYVERFPLRLPSRITSGLALFDYHGNNDFRLFVGCANGHVYGFRKSGKPLPGWNPKRDVGVLQYPLTHILHDRKDYLIATNEKGTVYLWNRRGDKRIPEVRLNTRFNQPFYMEVRDGSLELINAGEEGILYTIRTDGTCLTDSIRSFEGTVYFLLADLDQDGRKNYVFKDSNALRAYRPDLSSLFTYSLTTGTTGPVFLEEAPNGEIYTGFAHSERGHIYLINSTGNIHEDFPLPGITPFRIVELLDDETMIVVTGTADNTVTTYRLK